MNPYFPAPETKRIKLTTTTSGVANSGSPSIPAQQNDISENSNKSIRVTVSSQTQATNTLLSNEEIYEKDVPILSNVGEVHVSHYLLNLRFSPETGKRTVAGTAILFLVKGKGKPEKQGSPGNNKQGHYPSPSNNSTESEQETDNISKIVLDCCSMQVSKVEAFYANFNHSLELNLDNEQNLNQLYSVFQLKAESNLDFEVDRWSLSMWGWGEDQFPTAVRIEYETLSTNPSLQWRPMSRLGLKPEQICCYSPGAPVNNRGLFPCQEHPSSMATWQCFVQVNRPYSAFLSSDKAGIDIPLQQIDNETGKLCSATTVISYFNCSEVLPMSTFALVISIFVPSNIIEIKHARLSSKNLSFVQYSNKTKVGNETESDSEAMYPVRLILQNTNSTIQDGKAYYKELLLFIIALLEESSKLLGALPFPRLDVIIMPPCFPTLGFANPNMIFLSPSVLTQVPFTGSSVIPGSTSSLCRNSLVFSRLAHELSHFWFGLSVGAMDWNEEWLSEGFATFIEGVLYEAVLQSQSASNDSHELELQNLHLRPYVMLITLQQELENTDTDSANASSQNEDYLKLLCSPKDRDSTATAPATHSWKNGLDPMKQLVQVHYLKGYFFLKQLSNLVSEQRFLLFLKNYVLTFRSKLVTTNIFLNFFKESFCLCKNDILNPSVDVATVDLIAENWLYCPQLPEPHASLNLTQPTMIIPEDIQTVFGAKCLDSISKINSISLQFDCCRFHSDNEKYVPAKYDIHDAPDTYGDDSHDNAFKGKLNPNVGLSSNEKIIFLEQILHTRNQLDDDQFEKLEKLIRPELENPEVMHRWCEAIVKFRFTQKIQMVQQFLLSHPAMGVFLYGELMISEEKIFQKLAKKVYKLSKEVLDPPCQQVLRSMLF